MNVLKKQSRTKKSLYNAIANSIALLVTTIFQLVSVRTVLLYLGSEYNGVNGIINSFLSVLMLFESGFTIATLVMIYEPYEQEDYQLLNRILSKTYLVFRKIGILMFLVGMILATVYCCFIKSDIQYIVLLTLFFFSILTTSFNFFYVYKYRLLFQVSQNEYILHLLSILYAIIGQGGMILIIYYTQDIIYARGFFTIITLLYGFLISLFAKKLFPLISFGEECSDIQIKGTNDLLAVKVAGMLSNICTVFFLATFVGATTASVYAVYESVIRVIYSYSFVFLSAPKNSLGQIIQTDRSRLKDVLIEFEYWVSVILTILFSITFILIIPFVKLYTSGVTDVNYIQPSLGALLILISVTEILRIPSGMCIEMSGLFMLERQYMIFATIILLVLSVLGGLIWGLWGLLIAKFIFNIILGCIEVGYTHFRIVNKTFCLFAKNVVPNMLFAFTVSCIGYKLVEPIITSWQAFVAIGIIVTASIIVLTIVFNWIYNPKMVLTVIKRIKPIVKK